MRRPAIGITVDQHSKPDCYESPVAYAKAVETAGGLPLLLPYHINIELIPLFLDQLDGILMTGGNDLDPALFNEARHPKAIPLDPIRQKFELALLDEIAKRRTPTLGICMGSQIMNVYRGGSLHQFLPDVPRENAIEHRKLTEMRPHPVQGTPQFAHWPRHGKKRNPRQHFSQAIGECAREEFARGGHRPRWRN